MVSRRTSWLEVQFEVAPDAAEVIAAAASEVAEGVELRDAGTVIKAAPDRAMVIAHVAPEDREQLLATVQEAAAVAREAGVTVDPVVVREREAHEDEWRDVWKQFFRATRVGRTFIVRPSWDPGALVDGDRVIDIDPGRAFGTGGHASTRLVIALAERVADGPTGSDAPTGAVGQPIARFLDIGCGSGILSIAASLLWPAAHGMAVDIDPDSAACARENLDRNHVTSVDVAAGTLEIVPREPPFDLVLANIQADILAGMAKGLAARVRAGGTAILSGLLLRDADPVLGMFREAGFDLIERRDEGDWAALALRRRAEG